MESIRILELFGGIGACSQAFQRLNIPHKIVDYVEIDKYAVKSYNAIHGTNFEPQDITQWDKDIDVDFIMHGSPCQDFSIAGRGMGGDKGSGTRSSLMYETVRIVEKLKPTYVLWENVANMMSDKHRHNFDAYWDAMETMGYRNASYRLNAKDYGVPQNRVRIFTLSILNSHWKEDYFTPPKTLPFNKCLADVLEPNVDEKYYLSDKALEGLIKHKQKHQEKGNGFGCRIIDMHEYNFPVLPMYSSLRKNGISTLSPTLSARYYKDGAECLIREPKVKQIGNLFQYKRENPSAGRVYDQSGLCPTLTNMQGGHRQPYIFEPFPTTNHRIFGCTCSTIYKQETRDLMERILNYKGYDGMKGTIGIPIVNATKAGYDLAFHGDSVNLNYPQSTTRRGRVGHGCAQTLTCSDSMGVVVGNPRHEMSSFGFIEGLGSFPWLYSVQYRIRKLTPKECWRLMGFNDVEFEKAAHVCSNTQLYKQAGNSIVVNVLEAILKKIFFIER